MPRKYLRKTLEIRVADTKIYVYNDNGDLIRTHERSYTPKSWVVLPTDMSKEYSDYSFWNMSYFLAKSGNVGPNTWALIQRVIEKFDYPVQSFRSCFGILKFAEKYGKDALESCCKYAILRRKCSYNYITNTISMYAHPVTEIIDRMACSLKPVNKDQTVTVAYKDDASRYSLKNIQKKQEGGDLQLAKSPMILGEMLDGLGLTTAAIRWKQILNPELGNITAQQLFREILIQQYVETMNKRYKTNLKFSKLIEQSARARI